MWIVKVVVVMVMTVRCASLEDDTISRLPESPQYERCANTLFHKMTDRLDDDMTSLSTKISNINMKIRSLSEQLSTPVTRQVDVGSDHEQMAALVSKIETMDEKLNDKLTNMNKNDVTLHERVDDLAKSHELHELNGSMSYMLHETVRYVESRVGEMARKSEIEELLNTSIRKMIEAVGLITDTCASNAKLTELQLEVRELKGSIKEVATATEAMLDEGMQCTQETSTAMETVETEVEELQQKIEKLDSDLQEKFGNFEEMIIEILNFTRLPPPPPPPTTTTTTTTTTERPPELYPCEDSTFVGPKAINVCHNAVLYKRCQLQTVAYHCCHSCTSSGQLPEEGPWRYLNKTRVVSTIDVIRYFSL